MKRLIVISLVLAVSIIFSSVIVLASPITEISEISENKYAIRINTQINPEDVGKNVNIIVLNPNKTIDDIGVDEDALQMQNTLKAENEVFTYSFPIHLDDVNDTGYYKIRIKVEGKDAEEDKVYFASNNDRKVFLVKMNQAEDFTSLVGFLDEAKMALGYDNALFAAVDKVRLSQMMYQDIQISKLNIENISKGTNQIKEYIITEAFNEGLISYLFDEKYTILNKDIIKPETIDENGVDIYSNVYSEILNSDGKKLVAESLINKEYQNVSELKADFATLTMMYALTNSSKSGSGHISEILTEENAKKTGINISKYLNITSSTKKALIDDELMSKNYLKLSDVEGYIEQAIANLPTDKPGGNAGGVGGAGGGGGSVRFPSNVDIQSSLLSDKEVTTVPFDDLENYDWAKEAILYLYEKGYVNGVSEKHFAPEKNVTREQFVVMLLRALEEKLTDGSEEFEDIIAGSYYEKYVNTAYKLGIVNGIDDRKFGVAENISRQDFATMIFRALKIKHIELQENKSKIEFIDSNEISDYAKEGVEKLVKYGVINGFSDGTFRPTDLCTRAQAAKVIYEIVKGD